MKKLLSLLSVLTIGGTAVPSVIAASPYQKEEKLNNSDINYQQINNLRILNREKRESNKFITIFSYKENKSFNGTWTNDRSAVGWKIDYSNYANSWEDLIKKFSKINIIGNVTVHLLDGNHIENNLIKPLTNLIPDVNSAGNALIYDWVDYKFSSGPTSQEIKLSFLFTKDNKFLHFGISKEVDSYFANQGLWYEYSIDKIIID